MEEAVFSRSMLRKASRPKLTRYVRNHIAQRYRYSQSHALILGSSALPSSPAEEPGMDVLVKHEADSALVRNVKFTEQALPHKNNPALILTPDEKVAQVIGELQDKFPSKMVGEVGWSDTALDYIVASPQQVISLSHKHGRYISAVLLDGGLHFPGAKEALDRIETFMEFSGYPDPASHTIRVLVLNIEPQYPSFQDVSRTLLSKLPEAIGCPGLGDFMFTDLVQVFARRDDTSVSVTDWSGILALLPGLVRATFQGRTSLVVAQASRVTPTVELIQEFVKHLGLSHTRLVSTYVNTGAAQAQAQLLVGTLDVAAIGACSKPENFGKVAFLELDVLLESGKLGEMQWLLSHASNADFAFHYTSECAREKWRQAAAHVRDYPSGAFSLTHACLFVEDAPDDSTKLDKVREIYKRLANARETAVVCNSEDKAREVVDRLSSLGVPAMAGGKATRGVLAVTYEMDRECLRELVVVFEMPRDHEEYVRRCGASRSQRIRVINLVSGEEDSEFLRGLNKELIPLPRADLERLTKKYICGKRRFPPKRHAVEVEGPRRPPLRTPVAGPPMGQWWSGDGEVSLLVA